MQVLGKRSIYITCPSCRAAQRTRVELKNTKKTHIVACLLIPVLFCWCPYVSRSFREAEHYCSVCDVFLGRTDLQLSA